MLFLRGVVIASLFAVGAASAEVQCEMPNGVVVTKNFGDCPADAKRIAGEPVYPEGAAPAAPVVREKVTPAAQSPAPYAVDPKTRPAKPAASDGYGMSFGAWFFFIALAVGLVAAIKGSAGVSGKVYFCTSCGHEGKGRTVTRGNLLIEIVLWCCFLIPGLIYSIWRQGSKFKACAECGSKTLVPPGSPIAMATKRMLAADAAAQSASNPSN